MALKKGAERKPSEPPKTLRRSRSFKHTHDQEATASRSVNPLPQNCPNYMKSTRSFEARTAKLVKRHSLKVRKASSLRIVGVSLEKVQRNTCASTLKDVSFPTYLPLTRGATEARGPSLSRVCPYNYCSLNGYHHKEVVPLRYFIRERRLLMRSEELDRGNVVQAENFNDARSASDRHVESVSVSYEGDELNELPAKSYDFGSGGEEERKVMNNSSENDYEEDLEVRYENGRLDDLEEDSASAKDSEEDEKGRGEGGISVEVAGAFGEIVLENDIKRDENSKNEGGAECFAIENEFEGMDQIPGCASLKSEGDGRSDDFERSLDYAEDADGRSVADFDDDDKQGSEYGRSERLMNNVVKNDSDEVSKGYESGRSSEFAESLTNNDLEEGCEEDDEEYESRRSNEFAESLTNSASSTCREGFGSGRTNESKESLVCVGLDHVFEDCERGGRNCSPTETRGDIGQTPGSDAVGSCEDLQEISNKEYEDLATRGKIGGAISKRYARESDEDREEIAMVEYEGNERREGINQVSESEAGESSASNRSDVEAGEGVNLRIEFLKENIKPVSRTSLLEEQRESTCKGTQKKNINKNRYKRRTWDVVATESNYFGWEIGWGKPQDTPEETDYSQREPNFLPMVPDPEGEKVDLRHQDMDDRRNADEWMIDHALQKTVSKLATVKTKKVELIVEAFESVLPAEGLPLHGQLCN